ncbi:MAG: hypothetical protein V4601_01775 [Pseudomonadota bacterium]
MTRSQQRFATASAAILVQIALITLFAHSFLPGKPQQVAREMMLLLRPLLRPQPPARQAERPLPRMIVPPASVASPTPGDRAANMLAAPPSALEGIGRALFACGPERYGLLTREEQARCPPPGEGLARLPDANLLSPPKSLSRDAVMWAEVVAAREFTPNCFMNGSGGSNAACMIRQAQAERARAKQAMVEYQFDKARRNAPPPPPKPIWVGVPKR